MKAPVELTCPAHREPLSENLARGEYACPRGCAYPVVRGVPRFVPLDNYAAAFGIQWNAFRKTQLDSHTGTAISHDRLCRIAGAISRYSATRRSWKRVAEPVDSQS